MSPNTGGNTANENAESNENVKSPQSSRLDVFAKQFANDIFLKTPKNERFSMMNTYFSNDTFTTDQEREVMKFAGTKEGFSDLKLSDINYYNIRKHFTKEYTQYNSTFVMFKNKVLKHYDITHNEYLELVIESELKSMSLDSINELLKSTKKLDEFIHNFKQDNNDKEINKRDSESVLPKNFTKIMTDKIESLDENKRQEVDNILVYFQNSSIRDDSFARNFSEKIDSLHNLKIFSKSEITELIVTFVPSISIKDAKKHISSGQENNFKNDVLKTLNLENASLSEDEKKAIYESLDDLLIDTSIFLDGNFSDLKSVLGDKKLLEKAGEEIKQTIIGVENENGVSTLAGFKDALKENKIDIDLKYFNRGSVIEYIIKDKEGNTKKQYYQIESNIDNVKDGTLLFINRGINALGGEDGNYPTSFKQLLESLKKFKENNLLVGFNVYDSNLLKEKINKEEIIEDNDMGEFNTETQIESNINRRTNEINANSELSDEEKTQKIKEIKEDEEKFNLKLLEKKVNHIDSQGREFGLDKGTTISYVDDKKNKNIFTVIKSDQNTITIDHGNGNTETMLFEDFLNGFTRNPTPERVSKINNETDFLDTLKSDSKELWGDIQVKNGKIVKQGKDSDLKDVFTEYDLFIGEQDLPGLECNLMKLHKIENGKAIISYGEASYEKAKNADKKKIDKEIKDKGAKKQYSIDSKKYEITLGVFHSYIKQSGAIARNFEKETEQSDLPEEVKMKSGLMSRIFQKASFADLMASGKLIIDSIENKLKEGNEEMAAKWADKIPLPEDLKRDMQTRIEQAQKKRGDEFFDRLKIVDSSVAIKMIKKIIEDKNSPEAKREGCLLFMAKSYGHLYTKTGLFENQGRFLWYTSFGGTIGDEMYREAEAKAKKDGTNFTEHELMISLLGNQCKDKPPKPKRRSKLHKEYKAMMGDGKQGEQEKGAKDAKDKRTFDGRLYGVALDELADGGHNNAVGAITELIGKGDDGKMPRLETLPFVMMMSGIAYDFDSDLQQDIRRPLSEGVPMISLGYLSTNSGITLYNNAVVEISKILEKDNPIKYSGMAGRAEKIVIDSRKKSKEPRDRMTQALDFYEEYGDILSRTLNMTASRRIDSEAKYESLLQLNANDPNGNEILKAFYDDYSGTRDAFFNADKADDFMEDAYQSKTGEGYGGITGMAPEQVFKSAFKGQPGKSYALNSSEMLHKEFVEQLKSYTKTNFDTPGDRENVMKEYIMAYIYGFLYNHEKNIQNNIKSPGFQFMGLLDASQINNVTASDFKSSTKNKDRSKESETLIKDCLNNVLSKNTNNSIGFDINNVDGYVDDVKNQTNKVIDTENEEINNN